MRELRRMFEKNKLKISTMILKKMHIANTSFVSIEVERINRLASDLFIIKKEGALFNHLIHENRDSHLCK